MRLTGWTDEGERILRDGASGNLALINCSCVRQVSSIEGGTWNADVH